MNEVQPLTDTLKNKTKKKTPKKKKTNKQTKTEQNENTLIIQKTHGYKHL